VNSVPPPRVSVIVSTYEWPDALHLVLEGYRVSDFKDFEVVVADDGSSSTTRQVVERFEKIDSFRLIHVHQPDHGFRLATVRNLAVRAARGAILVFTDGDCIPFRDCLGVHAERCRPGVAQAGSRCFLGPDETTHLLASGGLDESLLGSLRQRERSALERLRRRNRLYAWTHLKPRPKLQTANAAIHRSDFERINGFDERFRGWGYEDEDLARRLRRCGTRILDACTESLMAHLFHPVHKSHRPNARQSANYAYFRSGNFLTSPLEGLRQRDAQTLRIELCGAIPEGLRAFARNARKAAGGQRRCEVGVIFGSCRSLWRRSLWRGSLWRWSSAEVLLKVPNPDTVRNEADLYRFLGQELAVPFPSAY